MADCTETDCLRKKSRRKQLARECFSLEGDKRVKKIIYKNEK